LFGKKLKEKGVKEKKRGGGGRKTVLFSSMGGMGGEMGTRY